MNLIFNFSTVVIGLTFFLLWYLTRKKDDNKSMFDPSITVKYFTGLNYLLNEEDDKAIEIFIKLFTVDQDTAETHLAIGNLFRKRGELDKAIRIHQNLIARPQLTFDQRVDGLLALGKDYLTTGLFDRAEKIFREIVDSKVSKSKDALHYLLDIYQKEKYWEQAIVVAKKIEKTTGENLHNEISHYYCELCEYALSNEDILIAKEYLEQVFVYNHHSIRANILKARVMLYENQFKEAAALCEKIVTNNANFLPEIFDTVKYCYEKLGSYRSSINRLADLVTNNSNVGFGNILFILGELEKSDSEHLLNKLIEFLDKNPSLFGLAKLMSFYAVQNNDKQDFYEKMLSIINKLLDKKPYYKCESCGFNCKYLYWCCPSCRKWDKIRILLDDV